MFTSSNSFLVSGITTNRNLQDAQLNLNKNYSFITSKMNSINLFPVEEKQTLKTEKLKVDFIKPAKLFDNLDIITFYTGNSFTSLNLIQKIEKDGVDISKIDVQLVWIDGIKSKPIKIPRNIIDRFKSMEIV